VRVAIDDFGVGYSSLSQLLTLPLDQLKIDRSFIGALGADPRAEAIVRSAVELGRTLGLAVVAEGVECHAELEQVRRTGVDLVQGFGLERPVAIAEVSAILERREAARPIRAG
jgi:Amt family ammonium transporter